MTREVHFESNCMTNTVKIEHLATDSSFVHLSTIAGIKVDLRYATSNNFVGQDMYAPFDCAWLHQTAANDL